MATPIRWERKDTSPDSSYLAEILKMHKAGYPSTFIGKHFGKDHTTILYHLRKMGVATTGGRGYRRPIPPTSTQAYQTPAANPVKKSPYEDLLNEPLNPGKMYKDYLKKEGKKTPKQIKKILDQKRRAARGGGHEASLPNNYGTL